jgi:small subunit ribosomal protein S4
VLVSISDKAKLTRSPVSTAVLPVRAHLTLDFSFAKQSQAHVRRAGKVFRRYFEEADRRKGNTGANFAVLECRLDNVVYRMVSARRALNLVSWCR